MSPCAKGEREAPPAFLQHLLSHMPPRLSNVAKFASPKDQAANASLVSGAASSAGRVRVERFTESAETAQGKHAVRN